MQTNKMRRALCTAAIALALSSTVSAKAKVPKGAGKAPKYVFLFIGDGMSYPQFQAAANYSGVISDDGYMKANPSVKDKGGATLKGPKPLNFMAFPVAGSAVTYDSCSFAPDSASTATSIATGHKTYSGSINVDETATKKYETIAEKVHKQLGMKVGIISTVNLNHATPAAFYAHQASRSSYYAIGEELIASGFEYFAGGGLLKPADKGQENLYDKARKAGYFVAKTRSEADALIEGKGAKDKKIILIDENLADDDALSYELDRTQEMTPLASYVKKGIQVLDGKQGFFMMCEGGKIDWACHANDAASTIHDTLALADAVQVAIDFAAGHKDETLILVTGDHETGGLTIGFAGTDYDTYLSLLKAQTISFAKYDTDYVAGYKQNKTAFDTVMKDVERLFGLKLSGGKGDRLVLTSYETELLRTAYNKTLSGTGADKGNQAEYVAYGTYEPLSVTITHILNNKAGVSFTSYSHTGLPVAVFAFGASAEDYRGYYDNTQIYEKMAKAVGVR